MLTENSHVTSQFGFSGARWHTLSLRYCVMCLFSYCLFWGVLAIALKVFAQFQSELEFIYLRQNLGFGILIFCLLFIYIIAACRSKSYLVKEHDLSFGCGVIFKRVSIQPFTRLQHIEITRGPMERAFGLATLKLFSAGGPLNTLSIPGLLLEQAETLRGAILDSKGLRYEQ